MSSDPEKARWSMTKEVCPYCLSNKPCTVKKTATEIVWICMVCDGLVKQERRDEQ